MQYKKQFGSVLQVLPATDRSVHMGFYSQCRSLPFLMTAVLIVASFFSPIGSYAVESVCLSNIVSHMMEGDNVANDAEFYKNSKRMLFLSDGSGLAEQVLLGKKIAKQFPDKQVVRTDYVLNKTKVEGNLTSMFMDNTKPFPFRDNEFDNVVLRRGLCACQGTIVCAGFCPTTSAAKSFFSEVARVLNKTNPHAQAVLHGSYAVTPEITDYWKKIAVEIEEEQGVQIEFNLYPGLRIFHSISIKPAVAQ